MNIIRINYFQEFTRVNFTVITETNIQNFFICYYEMLFYVHW
jgi:hypothetical protein